MKKKKKKKGLLSSRFYRVYFAVVAVLLSAIAIGLAWLNGQARAYEAAQPIHVAEEVAKLFENGDWATLYTLDTSAQAIAEGDQAFYVESLSELTANRTLQWNPSFSSNENERQYTVTLDGGRFATFTLIPDAVSYWRLASVTTNVVTEKQVVKQDPANMPYRIRVPEGYAVTIDSIALTDENVISTGISALPSDFQLPRGVTGPMLTEYGFTSESATPQITVTDGTGAAQAVELERESVWLCKPKENTEFREKYAEALIKLGQSMAKYTTQDLSQGDMLAATVSDSPAESKIKKFSNYWAPTHKSVKFRDAEVTDCYVLSDKCVTCRVKFDYVIVSVRDNEFVYPTEYTFCIVKSGGKGKLYDIYIQVKSE